MVEEVVVMKEVLTKEMIDGGAELLQRLDEANLDVQVALWAYLWESNRWWLVFALPEVQKKGSAKNYQKIHAALDPISDDQSSVYWNDINVTGTDDCFISMLLKQGKSAMPLMTRVYFSGEMLYGRHVEEAYIYRLGKATMCAHVDIGGSIDGLVPLLLNGHTHLLIFNQLRKSHEHDEYKGIWSKSETFYEYTCQAHFDVACRYAAKLFEGDRYRSSRDKGVSIYSFLRGAQSTKKFPYATKQKVRASLASYDKRFLEKNRLLFSVNSTPHNDSELDSGSVPDEFKEHLLLSQNVTVNKERMHLAEREMQGENRLVTALFADISGFTPLSQRLPTKSVVEKVNQCFQAVTDAVYRYEGSVNRFIGDCVLAFFGAPLAHENDPERAILAGLDMKAEVVKLGLNLSVGINTGTMYFGPIGTQRHLEVSAYGPDINLAKRLQETAKPGQVIIGESTYRLTRRAFEFQPLSPLTLKGIAKPVPAYEAVKVSPRPEKIRGIEGLRAPMIGREEEFAKLKGCLDDLMDGRGQIASIIGVAGVGKSRLVSELKTYLERMEGKEGREEGKEVEQAASLLGKQMEEREGWKDGSVEQSAIRNKPPSSIWLEGRCLSIGESVGYWVFIDILKSYFQFDATNSERAMAEKITAAVKELLPQQADEILPLFGNLLSVKFGNELDERLKFAGPEQIKHQTFMALRDFFFALAGKQPLTLVFEDLHWADSLSLDLILLLMEMLTLAPMLLICVYRPEQDHKSWRIGSIASSKCLERYTEIHLRELRPQESRRMVEELLTIENLPENVKNLILTKSEGNPFFVEEVIRLLIDSGAVYREGNVWVAKAEIESLAVPDTIQGVIMSRIDRLEEEVKYVLQCASVIGRLFRHRLLAYTSQRERDLDQHLWRLEDRDLVYEERAVPELEYSFKHVLTQETAYQSLLARRRAAFHRKVAEGIEALYRERLEEFYEELAYHYDESGEVEKTVEYLLKAGEKARRAYVNDEAIRYFQRALERLDGSPLGESRPDWRLAALKRLGQISHGIGKLAEAEAYFQQAIALGRKMGLQARELAGLYYWLGDVLAWQERNDEVLRIGEEELTLLENDKESIEAALLNTLMARIYGRKDEREKVREIIHRTAQFLERLPYSEELGLVYRMVFYGYAIREKNVEEGLKWLHTLEQKAEQHHDLRALGYVLAMKGGIAQYRGDLHGSNSWGQRALEVYKKIGDSKFASHDLGRMMG
ncbi:AAA family ATPase [Candidatus Poribacteria bacterium]|nr:AAA family ATPase [Candidatus Poribacteria bacterium]